MEGEGVSLLAALGAGVLTFVSPCVLPLVPAYLALLAGSMSATTFPRVTFFHALNFVIGFSLVFIALGASAGLVSSWILGYLTLWRQIAGAILMLLGLHMMGAFHIPFLNYEKRLPWTPKPNPGYIRSFLVGATFSLGWTPCVGPILGGILALASTTQSVLKGAYLLAAYSLGLGIPFLIFGLALRPAYLRRLQRYGRVVSLVGGILLIIMGGLIFTNRLVHLNRYFDFFGLGAGI